MSKKVKIILLVSFIIVSILVLSLIISTLINNVLNSKDDSTELYNKYHYSFHSEKDALEWDGGVGYAVFALGNCDTYLAEILHDGSGEVYKHFISTATRGDEYIRYTIKYSHTLEEISQDICNYTYNETVTVGGVDIQLYEASGFVAYGFDYGGNAYTVEIKSAKSFDTYIPSLESLIENLLKANPVLAIKTRKDTQTYEKTSDSAHSSLLCGYARLLRRRLIQGVGILRRADRQNDERG